jgi:hypothetical protein
MKVIKLKESDIYRMVERVLTEQTEQTEQGEWKGDPNDRSMQINTKTGEKRKVFQQGKVPQYSDEDLKLRKEILKKRDDLMFSNPEEHHKLTQQLRDLADKYK